MTEIEKLTKQIMKQAKLDGEPVTEAEALEMAKMEIGAKDVIPTDGTREAKKERKPRQPKPEKVEIIKKIHNFLLTNGFEDATIVNEQREIQFKDFSITLIQHRPKKEG